MIRQIRLENFMSHKNTVLELAEGLTVLVGPNNCGKSAVVTALHFLGTLPGREGDYMVRHGEKGCRVEVTTGDGQTVAWIRRAAPSIEINGEAIPRVSQDQANALRRVHEVLRLPQVIVEDGKYTFDIHFGKQKSPVFLLDEPPSRAAVFFAASSDAQRLLEMQNLFRNKVKAKKGEVSQQTAEIERLERELVRLAPLEIIGPVIADLQKTHDELTTLASELAGRETVVSDMEALSKRHAKCAELTGFLAPLRPPPELRDVAALHDLTLLFEETLEGQSHLANCVDALAPLAPPPALADDPALQGLLDSLVATSARASRLRSMGAVYTTVQDPPTLGDVESFDSLLADYTSVASRGSLLSQSAMILEPLASPPALADVAAGEELVAEITTCRNRMESLRSHDVCLSTLSQPPTMEQESPLGELIAEIDSLHKRAQAASRRGGILVGMNEPPAAVDFSPIESTILEYTRLSARMKALAGELRETEQALRDWVAEHPFCPTCGAEIDAARIIAGGNGHVH